MTTETTAREEMVRIGARVREARKVKGITIYEASIKIGISPTCLTKIETGTGMIPLENIYVFSEYLEIPIEELIIKVLPTSKNEKTISAGEIKVAKELEEIGGKISSARFSKKLSLYDLCIKIGIEASEIDRIERGEKLIESKYLFDFSKYLEIPIEELVVKAPACTIESFLNLPYSGIARISKE